MSESKIIVSLDFDQEAQAWRFCNQLDPKQCQLKVGKTLFTQAGPRFVEKLIKYGFKVFLDLKYHDIPNTVADACTVAASLGVWMLNVHALGGATMLEEARKAIDHVHPSNPRPLLIAVTMLTSLAQEDLAGIGIAGNIEDQVMRLVSLAKEKALDGVVCAPTDLHRLSHIPNFVLVTPGIRLDKIECDDQKRTMGPIDAISSGSDYLVIGRPIIEAADPLKVIEQINAKIKDKVSRDADLPRPSATLN